MRILDLFSGIGGFSLGLESTGYFKTIAFVEKDEFCQKVLKKNFPNVPIESEVRNVKGKKYATEVVTGGFPCQPFSVAGKRKGTDDDRYLWDETIRIVAETKPKWFIGENVDGIINIQNGMVLKQVQNDLEKENFQVQCLVIPASGIGAWHQRKRTWIIANSKSERGGKPGIFNKEKRDETCSSTQSISCYKNVPHSNHSRNRASQYDLERERQKIDKRWKKKSQFKFSRYYDDVSNSDSELCRGWRSEPKSRINKIWKFSFKKKKQAQESLRSESEGCDDIFRKKTETWWETQSRICGVPDGLSEKLDKHRAKRIKSLGNSIVPLIARELGLAIMKAENENKIL